MKRDGAVTAGGYSLAEPDRMIFHLYVFEKKNGAGHRPAPWGRSRLGEQLGDRDFLVDAVDGVGEEVGYRQVFDLAALLGTVGGGDGVQEYQLLDGAFFDKVIGGAGEDAAPPMLTRASAAWQREPAVSTMSSKRMTCLP